MDCAGKRKLVRQIKDFVEHAKIILIQAGNKNSLSSLKIELAKIDSTRELIRQLSTEFLEYRLDLSRQYERELSALKQSGLIKELSSGEWGIIGINNQEYPIPTYQEIRQRLANYTDIDKRMRAGFIRLVLTPFALPLRQLFMILGLRLRYYDRANKLSGINGASINLADSYIDSYEFLDIEEEVGRNKYIYFPLFNNRYRAVTNAQSGADKLDLLEGAKESTTAPHINLNNGWNIILATDPHLQDNYHHLIESDNNRLTYFETMQQQNLQPMLIEDWLTMAITSLETDHQLIDWDRSVSMRRSADQEVLASKKLCFLGNYVVGRSALVTLQLKSYRNYLRNPSPREPYLKLSFWLDQLDLERFPNGANELYTRSVVGL